MRAGACSRAHPSEVCVTPTAKTSSGRLIIKRSTLLPLIVGLFFLVHPAAAQTKGGEKPWCDTFGTQLKQLTVDSPTETFQTVLQTIPASSGVFRSALESRLLDEEHRNELHTDLNTFYEHGCLAALTLSPGSLNRSKAQRSELERLRLDPKFGQHTRAEEDQLDRWINAMVTWLEEVFESEGMQFYASFSRVLYLSFLAILSVFFAWRIWRFRVKQSERPHHASKRQSETVQAIESVDLYLNKAKEALARGHYDVACEFSNRALRLHLEKMNLLESTEGLTNRQVHERLPNALALASNDVFQLYDFHMFSGQVEQDAAATLLLRTEDVLAHLMVTSSKGGVYE